MDRDISPGTFLLASSLDAAEEVLVVDNALTAGFIAKLGPIVRSAGAKLTRVRVEEGIDHDLWMQDTVELGAVVTEDGGTGPAAMLGLRGRNEELDGGPLDRRIEDTLRGRGWDCFTVGEPRVGTRWIDWYGNLAVSPPVEGFPSGRMLVGRQRGLDMHPGALEFLERQALQTPPLVVGTSWLEIGHVDEVVSFVPASDGRGWRVVVPGIAEARRLLEKLVGRGHGAARIPAGTGDECSAEELLEVARSGESRAIEERLRETRARLREGLGVSEEDFVPLPAVFREGAALVPNAVNSLVCNGHVIVPHPRGPVIDGEDVFAGAIREELEPLGLTVHLVDVWDSFHCRGGEIHCGTNAVRRVSL